MGNGIKRELAVLCGIGTLLTLRKNTPLASLFALTGAGLLASSFTKSISVKGKSVLITGGSRGLGLAIAEELLKADASVTIVARQQDELNRAKHILFEKYPDAEVQTLVCDVTDPEALKVVFSKTIGRWGSLDILINNAGAISVGPFESMTREDFEAQMNLHFYAVLEAVKCALPQFHRQGRGHIVNICSLGGKVAVPHMLPYDSSKYALAGLSQGLNAELSKDNILVTTIYPTVMRTGSPIQAVFKGNHEKEFAWFAGTDVFPGFSISAQSAAKQIVKTIENGDSELVPTIAGKTRIALATVLPELMSASMRWLSWLLPRGQSEIRKTGAQSRSLFDKRLILRPLVRRQNKVAKLYNQKPSTDPNFNMNLN